MTHFLFLLRDKKGFTAGCGFCSTKYLKKVTDKAKERDLEVCIYNTMESQKQKLSVTFFNNTLK